MGHYDEDDDEDTYWLKTAWASAGPLFFKDQSRKFNDWEKFGGGWKHKTAVVDCDPGDVGRHALIGPRSVVGRRCCLGQNAVVGDDSCVANDADVGQYVKFGRDANIGHYTVIGDSSFLCRGVMVDSHTVISERVRIEDNARIGNSTRIYHHVRIGEGTRIQDHVSIHSDAMIGRGCVVLNNSAVYSGSALGDGCFLGDAVSVPRNVSLNGGVVWDVSPLVIQGTLGKVVTVSPDHVDVGSFTLSVKRWSRDLKKLATMCRYLPVQLAEYDKYIRFASQWLRIHADRVRYASTRR